MPDINFYCLRFVVLSLLLLHSPSNLIHLLNSRVNVSTPFWHIFISCGRKLWCRFLLLSSLSTDIKALFSTELLRTITLNHPCCNKDEDKTKIMVHGQSTSATRVLRDQNYDKIKRNHVVPVRRLIRQVAIRD